MRRWLLAAAGLFLAAALALPFLKADSFAAQIREALERSLRRKVEFGKVRLHLLTRPGFSIDEVIIHEDPEIGLEPVAYVTSLDAGLHWRSLFTRRLEFSSLRLEEPSLNLVRTDRGAWNVQKLLSAVLESAPGGRVPRFEVRAGRVNFKSGDLKSAFYVTDADVDLTPESGGLSLTFSGEPARTDRGAEGFGRLSGRARWRTGDGRLDADLQLERNAISELSTLIAGRDLGLHGSVSSRVHLTGTLTGLEVGGELRLEDIHRWDLMPVRGREWPVGFRGRLDLSGQSLELAAGSSKAFTLRLRAKEWMTRPQWGVSVAVDGIPASSVIEVGRHMGFPLPEEPQVEGNLAGVVGYSSQNGLQGQVSLKGLQVRLADTPLVFSQGQVVVHGRVVEFGPAELEYGPHRPRVSATYNQESDSLAMELTARGLPLSDLKNLLRLAPTGESAGPWMARLEGGAWSGTLSYTRGAEEAPAWEGSFDLERSTLAIPELAKPIAVARASVSQGEGRLEVSRFRGSAGGIGFSADYRRLDDAAKRERLQVTIPQADAGELEALLQPVLVRRQGLIARALRRAPPPPEWLSSRRLEGGVRIGRLDLPGGPMESFGARLAWEGPSVDLLSVEARYRGAHIAGFLATDLRGASPKYRFSGRAEHLAWRDAEFDVEGTVEGTVEAEGTGAELWQNLISEGVLEARGLQIGGDDVKSISAAYLFGTVRGTPRLQVANMEMTWGQETYRGQGGSQADGRLVFDLASGRQKMRLGGSLAALQFEVAR